MLQRIQTIWIFLALLGSIFLFITSQDVEIVAGFPVTDVLSIILVILGALSIFSYNNRKRQAMLNTASIFINVLLIGLLLYWLLKLSGGIDFPEKGIEPIFPLLSIICLIMANIFIRRDERLVKSVDRLR